MGYKYAVVSDGSVLESHEVNSPVYFVPLPEKQQTLQNLSERVAETFREHRILAENNVFDFLIQPFYTEERLLFFTKEKLEASDIRVRQSANLKRNPSYHYNNKGLELQLRSIYPCKEGNKTNYYLLNIESFVMERNFTDGEYIRIKADVPIPYFGFYQNLEKSLLGKDEAQKIINMNGISPKYILESPSGRVYTDPENLLQKAILRDKPYPTALMDKAIDAAQDMLMLQYGMQHRDPNSNHKMFCLHQIVDCKRDEKKEFEIYNKFKKFLKTELPGTVGICYKKNAIYFRVNNERKVIFIVNAEKEHFNIGGYSVKGFEAMQDMFRKGTAFKETEWFEDIKPYVIEKEKVKRDKTLG